MGLPTALSFLRTGTGDQTLDVYLEPLCPFSARMARSLAANVVPQVQKGGKLEGKMQLIVRIYPQPFHYFSGYPCEAILIFGQEHPELFWDYLLASYEIQDEWFNKEVVDKTPRQIQQAYVDVMLAVLDKAGKLAPGAKSAESTKFMDKLQVHEKANGGSTMFMDLKYLVREGRQNGIHFTPTVLLNGLEDSSVSSSFGAAEWDKFFTEKVCVPTPSRL